MNAQGWTPGWSSTLDTEMMTAEITPVRTIEGTQDETVRAHRNTEYSERFLSRWLSARTGMLLPSRTR